MIEDFEYYQYIDLIPDTWWPLVITFVEATNWYIQNNNVPPVHITYIEDKYGELRISFTGGNLVIDGYANFARILSKKIQRN